MPEWCDDIAYAETFGCHPEDVRAVNVQWFERWRMLEQARAARVAVTRAAVLDDWTKLSADELRLLRWAKQEDDG